LKNNKDNKEAV